MQNLSSLFASLLKTLSDVNSVTTTRKNLVTGFLTIGTTVSVLTAGTVKAATFNFEFTLDDSNFQEVFDENGGTFGTLSFDENNLETGSYILGDLTNVEFAFNMGNAVVSTVLDPLSNVEIFVNRDGSSLELTKIDDIAGNFFQLQDGDTNVGFPNSNNKFLVGSGSQFEGDRSFKSGSFTAISSIPESIPESNHLIGLLTVGLMTTSIRRKITD